MTKTLEDAAFEIYSVILDDGSVDVDHEETTGFDWEQRFLQAVEHWRHVSTQAENQDSGSTEKHTEQCDQCRREEGGNADTKEASPVKPIEEGDSSTLASTLHGGAAVGSAYERARGTGIPFVTIDPLPTAPILYQASMVIGGMTCSSCVGTITHALDQVPWVRTVNVNLLTNSASVLFEGAEHASNMVEIIENIGYEAIVDNVEEVKVAIKPNRPTSTDLWRASYAIGGMTCSSCVGSITRALSQGLDWIESVDVNLVSNSATVTFRGRDHLAEIKDVIEGIGYEATMDDLSEIGEDREVDLQRKVAIRVDGMHCRQCPTRILDAIGKEFEERVEVDGPFTISDPILRITYLPYSPEFTIRHIIASIKKVNPAFEPSIYHPPTLEERSRRMHAREQRRVLLRLLLSIIVAIPTFIIGIVLMNLIKSSNRVRQYIMQPMWAGTVSRAEWALFIMATPVYFFAADVFHVRALKELRAMWRPN
ncbi:hypothetical protein LTR66_016270, partial [Elasticomyces elasticus]